jgi:hypothetical protein
MEESGIVGLEDTQARTAIVFPAFGEFELCSACGVLEQGGPG